MTIKTGGAQAGLTRSPTKNLGSIDLAFFPFIGCKHTDTQTSKVETENLRDINKKSL